MTNKNCFVDTAVSIATRAENYESVGLAELTILLAAEEPMLSHFNGECAAREALRWLAALEAGEAIQTPHPTDHEGCDGECAARELATNKTELG
jgi:hypothetical protein